MIKTLFNCAFLSVLLFTSSCASIFNGTTDKIHVSSSVPGTKFFLDNEEIGMDNASVVISKKKLKSVMLHAKKAGCQTKSSDIDTKFDPTTLLGILLDFGIISILIVDWGINGAVTEAERTNYVLNPVCPGA